MMMNFSHALAIVGFVACTLPSTAAFTKPSTSIISSRQLSNKSQQSIFSTPNDDASLEDETFGGFTAKQRLREEVESPFRKVRLYFFGFAAASASLALYFSAFAALKANIGGYTDAIPLEDALQTCAINLAGAIVFGGLSIREIKVGQGNLKRIAKGGLLARLVVDPAREEFGRRTVKEYRRNSRVVIAAGGADYINRLAMSLCSDQLADENMLPGALNGVDVVVVPVLLNSEGRPVETKTAWTNAVPGENDRNFDCTRADEIVSFPNGFNMWNEYLESDVETAKGQGFDVLNKGITITIKKNGKILRRATGLPPFGDFIGVMEVADGSRFGMPGDSEKYGGP